jgi:hypothetical protein
VPDFEAAGATSNIVFSDTYGDLSFGALRQLSSISFEGPSLPPPSVPEPASWAMMLVGFGIAGIALRSRRTKLRFA